MFKFSLAVCRGREKKSLAFLVWIFLFISPVLFSQEVKDTAHTIRFDEIKVIATKTSVNRNNIPMTVSVISREDIENSSESALIPVLSEQVPGLFVTERGITGFGVSTGSAGQISLRGIGGSPNTQVLVLVNGNPQFMGIMGHPLPDSYVASDVEKVEVIRGPASTLYGTNAMGGVINIITSEQKDDGYTTHARIMYGSYNTQKYMVNGGFKKGAFNLFASLNHDKTDGHRDSSDFSIYNGYLRMGYKVNQHFQLHTDANMAWFKGSDPGKEDEKAGARIDITRGMVAAGLLNTFEKTNGSFQVFMNFGEHHITDGFHSRDHNFGMILYQSLNLFKENTITLGVDYKNYGGIAENVKAMHGNGMIFGDTSVYEIAGYIYIQQNLFDKLTLNAGMRIEKSSVYGYEPVPTGGLAYRATSSTTLKASVSKGFRSPTIRELYLWGLAPDLKPEHIVNVEAGIIQKLNDNKWSLELTAFVAKGDNMIVSGSDGLKYENSGSFSNSGIEFSGTFKPCDRMVLNANYSYISMNKKVLATPEQQLFLSGTLKQKNLSLNVSFQYIHNLYTQLIPFEVNENYGLIHLRMAYKINSYADIFIKGENLTNKKYYINSGYPMPGIILYGGFNVHLQKSKQSINNLQ